jgi:hypothetical protein
MVVEVRRRWFGAINKSVGWGPSSGSFYRAEDGEGRRHWVKKWLVAACALSTPSVSLGKGRDRAAALILGGEEVGSLCAWFP